MDDPSPLSDKMPEIEPDTGAAPQQSWPDDLAPAQLQLAPSPPADPPWGFADLGMFVLFGAVTFVLISSGSVAMYLALRDRLGWTWRVDELMVQTPFVVMVQLASSAAWFAFIYFIVTKRYRRPFLEAVRWRPVASGLRM